MTQHIEEALIGYVMRYGGMCRDCADMDGVCQSGMPCDTDQRRAVIRHTIAALAYGINNGFIASPFTDTTALAAAEERGRIAERERRSTETDDVDTLVPSTNSACGEQVRDQWFVERNLPIMAVSGDTESDCVLKLHYRRPVSDDDRMALVEALNAYQAAIPRDGVNLCGALKVTLASLVATTSLIIRAEDMRVKPSKAVASDAMFVRMLKDYDAATIMARAVLASQVEAKS